MRRENDGLEDPRGWSTELVHQPRPMESDLMGLPPKDPGEGDDESDDDDEEDDDDRDDEEAVIREPDE